MPTTFASFGGETRTAPSSGASVPEQKSAFDTFAGNEVFTPPTLPPQETYGAWFPAKPETDTPTNAGLKATGNLLSSGYNLVKSVASLARHPIRTARGIGELIGEGIGTLGGLGLTKAKESMGLVPSGSTDNYDVSTPKFDALVGYLKDRYGSVENLQRTATNDPIGFGTDVVTLLQGGAGIIGKTTKLNEAISAVGGTATKPFKKAGDIVGKTTRFGLAQATGLNPETITNIVREPSVFSPKTFEAASRNDLAQVVKQGIDSRLRSLESLGEGYESIRSLTNPVVIDRATIESVLKKYGVKIQDGKVITTSESVPLSTADKTALTDFYGTYGGADLLSPNGFLNLRSALTQLAKFDAAKTGNLNNIAKELRATYNEIARPQIPGLKALDEKYAPVVKQLRQIKKDYLTTEGNFKDGAVNKIANLTGTGKEQVLGRLKEIIPDIEKRVNIVRTAEDIERASGLKVGTYARAGIGVFGATTGNIPAIIGAILSTPEIAVRLLRSYGLTKQQIAVIVKSLYAIANDVAGFHLPVGVKIDTFLENYFGLRFGTLDAIRKRIEETPNKQGGFARIKFSDAEYDRVAKVLEKYDTTPATVNHAPVLQNVDAEFRLGQLQTKLKRTSLSKDEIIEARNLLEKMGAIEGKPLGTKGGAPQSREKAQVPSSNDTTIPPDLQPLAEEARKYKTAEEFVKAQPKIYNFSEKGSTPMGKSTFFTPTEKSDYNMPGRLKTEVVITDGSKIYKGSSSEAYLNKIGYDFNTKEPIIEKMTGGKLHTVNDLFDDSGEFPNLEFSAMQQIAERDLSKKGYGGAFWNNEDDLTPQQYQIWDKSVLKNSSQLLDLWKKANNK